MAQLFLDDNEYGQTIHFFISCNMAFAKQKDKVGCSTITSFTTLSTWWRWYQRHDISVSFSQFNEKTHH